MKLPNDKFCVLPWISLETSPLGTIKPCCMAGEEVKDHNGKTMSLMTNTLDEAQQSKYMQQGYDVQIELRTCVTRARFTTTCAAKKKTRAFDGKTHNTLSLVEESAPVFCVCLFFWPHEPSSS